MKEELTIKIVGEVTMRDSEGSRFQALQAKLCYVKGQKVRHGTMEVDKGLADLHEDPIESLIGSAFAHLKAMRRNALRNERKFHRESFREVCETCGRPKFWK